MAVTREELEACMRDVDGDAQLHLLADYEELDEDQREHLNEQLAVSSKKCRKLAARCRDQGARIEALEAQLAGETRWTW